MDVTRETKCRSCGEELKRAYFLGNIFPSGFVTDVGTIKNDSKAPLILAECSSCGLIQLEHTVNLDLMYRQYWYSSSLNKSMVSSLRDIVNDVESYIELKDGDTVIDIGCNDGTLLQQYSAKEIFKVGFDPALNLSRPSDFFFVNDYFSAETCKLIQHRENIIYGKAKVITAIAMFYDLPDPNKFLDDVKSVLAEDGIFVVQFTDLLSMYKATAFDNICHEHLEYYKLSDVVRLLHRNGLVPVKVSYNDVNGGSIRVFARHAGIYSIPYYSVQKALKEEEEFLKKNTIETFASNIQKAKDDLKSFVSIASLLGHRIYILGASTKGNTLLQVCNISGDQIKYAAEVNKDKFGLYTVGSNIKIISEEEALGRNPDYFIVPVWHFEKNLLTKEPIRQYIRNGGKLVFPLPSFHIVGKDDLKDD